MTKLLLATALALVAPAANAFATPDVIYSTTNNGTSFATIDPTTGASSVLGPSGYSSTWAAALDTDGTLWTIINGFSTATIASVDKTTGHATPAPNPIGTTMITLEIGADGTMYGIGYGDQRLYRIDKTTGVGTPVGGPSGVTSAMDVAFDCDGHLWATSMGHMWTVDTTTGAATVQWSITGVSGGASMIMGLMFDSSCRMLATTYNSPGDLYSIDALGAATMIGTTGLSMPHGGSIRTFVPDTQAPTTTDDVGTAWRSAPATVTLDASDGTGSGVDHTYYTLGTSPAAPTTASTVYDAAHKPTLANGEWIRYFSVDARGNAETEHSSPAAKVDVEAPATTDDVPASVAGGPVAVTLSSSDDLSGVAAIYYEVGTAPGLPTTASAQYDAASKPALRDGERIRYLAVDEAGNAEIAHTSAAAQVAGPAPVTPTVTSITSKRLVTLHLRARYGGHAVRALHALIDGRAVKIGHVVGGGYAVVVDMRGHACLPVTVQVKVMLRGARAMSLQRVFRTCVPGR